MNKLLTEITKSMDSLAQLIDPPAYDGRMKNLRHEFTALAYLVGELRLPWWKKCWKRINGS